ncbi:unnamed protein product, partial [Mesorhabditis belari]|uniref:Carbohydrate sulfotransferase n=1 Tax=Mesorhabditis belari TaxID=2138241 RepID=A0AAF3EZ51_9BILA
MPEESSIEKIPFRPAVEPTDTNFDQMGIFHCQIPKNAATIMKIVLCDLYRYWKGIAFKLQLTKDKQLSECQANGWWKEQVGAGKKYRRDFWQPGAEKTKIAVTRHPVKRFVSLYQFLCENFKLCGVKPDIHTFTKDIYTLLKTKSVKGTNFQEKDRDIIDYHAQPQTWFCNLAADHANFHLIHFSSDRVAMKSEIKGALDAAKVPAAYSEQVLKHIDGSDTSHANHNENRKGDLKKSLEENRESMQYIRAIYYQDYELLGFEEKTL